MAKLNILTLGSSKNYTDLVAFGLTNVVVNDTDKTISFTLVADGSTRTLHFDQPSDGKDGQNGISITGVNDLGNGKFTLLFSDGSESDPIQTIKGQKGDKGDKLTFNDLTDEEKASLKGDSGVSPIITENADNTDKIYKLDITTADSTFTTPNLKGADGQGGTGSGEENTIESISVNGTPISVDENKNVDITVPSIDGLAKTEEIPTKVSELTNDSGYLTEHQDISGKVDKVDGKSLIADSEIERLASVDNYDDTQVKTQIQAVANGLMDSVGYSADYKTIDIIAKNGVKKSVNVAPIISHASITELSDVDATNKATGKALVYNEATKKHEYATISGTDEKVKMDASTDAKYLGELLDNITIANENGELKVKKLDGQDVTITEINYLKGLTMNVMDLVNMFSNGGVKIINTPVATYAELLTLDKSSFIEGISYLVYVLADENYDNAKTTYLVDKVSETPTYFGFADSNRDFTSNPIDLATEITGKLGIANMDSDAIKALFTVDDTYKTATATNNAFSTHGAKSLYDELLLAIGNKANDSDLTAHKDDANIHVSEEDRTKWDSAKTHADSAHAPSNAQENVIEIVNVNGTALTPDENKNVNIDLSDYAKTADIPTTLPANGGNADTVNNHTVKSDVPENAVFTDTVLEVNDADVSKTTVWSSDKTASEIASAIAGGEVDLSAYQKKNDTGLCTLAQDIVGAINEVKEAVDGKINYDDTEVKTDITELQTKAHTHANTEVLDGITSENIQSWNNKSEFDGNYNTLTNKPALPVKLSDLTNDSGYITNIVDDLLNYYKKSDTYSKEEIAELIGNINKLTSEIVESLPIGNISTSTIYLIKDGDTNNYKQYMYISGAWAQLSDTNIDLSGYAKLTDLDTKVDKVAGKTLSTNDFTNVLKSKLDGIAEGANKTIVDTELSPTSLNPVQNAVVTTKINTLANKDGSDATGTWGIDISGTASKATADKNGNDITTTYAKQADFEKAVGIVDITNYTDQIIKNTDVVAYMFSTNIRKVGHIVTFVINITVKAVSSSYVELGTIPKGVRPPADVSYNILTNKGDACYVYIDSNGKFGIRKISTTEFAANDGVRFCANYITEE